MTSPDCASGTDRVAEVARRRPAAPTSCSISRATSRSWRPAAVSRWSRRCAPIPASRMGTLAHREPDAAALRSRATWSRWWWTRDGFALYFTRRRPRGRIARAARRCATSGVYAFRRDFLLEFAAWPPGAAGAGRASRAAARRRARRAHPGGRGRPAVRGRGHARAAGGAGAAWAARPTRARRQRGARGIRAPRSALGGGTGGRHGQDRRRHRRRGLVARQGHRRGLARAAAQGARPARHAAEARPLPQHRSRAR